ncbi:MAG: cytochrome c1 [Pseudomonadota bacterium]
MIRTFVNGRVLLCSALLALAAASAVMAAGNAELDHAQTDIGNVASLQRGAKLFVNYCQGCHGSQYMRYSRLGEDLDLTEEQIEENLIFSDAKVGDVMLSAMDPVDQEVWLGAKAPDLSVVSRSRGVDWLYTYLRQFYIDPSRPIGWNNKAYPNANMPNVFWEMQGVRKAVYETHENDEGVEETKLVGFEQVTEGTMTEEEFDQTMLDLVSYLEYLGEPAKLQRESLGIWVLLYLALFTFVAYLLKKEFWKDVK